MIRLESHSLSAAQLFNRYFFISGIVVIFLFTLFWNPGNGNLVPCYFHELTGHSCPSCGLTRSFHAIERLHFTQAFEFHPMGMIVYFVLLALLLKFTLEVASHKEIQVRLNARVKRLALAGVLFLWMSWWMIKLFNE